jgi:hypothetical protein
MTFWKREKDNERNQISGSQKLEVGEGLASKGTSRLRDVFSMLIVVVTIQHMPLSKLKLYALKAEF